MKKKGFTLIELLAVILILGIIALIAIPTVTNIIKESKRGAFKATVQNVMNAVETQCQLEQMRGEELTTSYSFTNGEVDKELNVKGDLPKSGTITVDSDCNVTLSVNNGDFCAIKSLDSDSVLIGDVEAGECVIDEDDKDNGDGGTANVPEPVSFADDDWTTIVANVKAGNLSKYNVGDTKEITLTGTNAGTYVIRIANTSTPTECSTEGFSQTACGFVVEFQDSILRYHMNAEDTNEGGWEDSELRNYINNTIYSSLPTELKEIIVDTMVVSGSKNSNVENFVTTDKLYLLTTQEVWGSNATYDMANDSTRQLDYYSNLGVTADNYAPASKNINGSSYNWWLRSIGVRWSNCFCSVDVGGAVPTTWDGSNPATHTLGVSPAFRIG